MIPGETLDRRKFRNAVAILFSIDAADFIAATHGDETSWRKFRDDPVMRFMRLGDAEAHAVWALVQARMPRELRFNPLPLAAE